MSTKPESQFAENPGVYASVDPDGIYTALLADLPPILSAAEAGSFLRVDKKRIIEMARTGELPGVPVPPEGVRRKYIIPKLSLIRFLVCEPGAGTAKGEDG